MRHLGRYDPWDAISTTAFVRASIRLVASNWNFQRASLFVIRRDVD
jgi:hypothetical protein